MTDIDGDFIRKIAGLARLEVSDDEVERLSSDLKSILGYVEKLSEIDTADVEPLSHVHGENNRFREDVVFCEATASQEEVAIHENKKEKIRTNVPERSGNFIKVPLIIDQESS